MSCDFLGVALALFINKWSNLLLDVLRKLLELSEFVEEFFRLLHLLILADVVSREELERFVELVQVEDRVVIFLVNRLHVILHADQGLDIGQIFVFNCAACVSFLHECLHRLDLLLSVLDHGRTSKVVDVGRRLSVEAGMVR